MTYRPLRPRPDLQLPETRPDSEHARWRAARELRAVSHCCNDCEKFAAPYRRQYEIHIRTCLWGYRTLSLDLCSVRRENRGSEQRSRDVNSPVSYPAWTTKYHTSNILFNGFFPFLFCRFIYIYLYFILLKRVFLYTISGGGGLQFF